MSKSTLSIFLKGGGFTVDRTVEVPCRLPESFPFSVLIPGHGVVKCIAYLTEHEEPAAARVAEVEPLGYDGNGYDLAKEVADATLASIKTYLGMGPDVMPTTRGVLSAIAIAYEAEVAAFEAQTKAFRSLPPALIGIGLLPPEPSDEVAGGIASPSARMLSKYVGHVVEQACKAQAERAEQAAKVVPFPSQVTP